MNNHIILVASAAFIFTAINQVISLPTGIRTILNEQLPTSALFTMHTMSTLMYSGWCVYGLMKSDPAMIIACGLGVICSSALLGCVAYVKHNNKKLNTISKQPNKTS